MNRILAFIACAVFALSALAAEPKTPAEAPASDYKPKIDKDGWEVLFDGKDLDAFDVPTNGSLVVTDQGELHVAKVGRNVYTGMEIQILDNEDHGVAFDAHNACGALCDMVPPAVPAVNPIGEWNHRKITVNDNVVQVELNGKAIVDADLNKWTTPHQNPNGMKNKYPHAIADLPREGFFGLQKHGDTPVWFRNVRIKPLTDRQPKYAGTKRPPAKASRRSP